MQVMQHKELLYRVAGLYERAGERRSARRVYLEVYTQDPNHRDLTAKLEALSENVRSVASSATVDERVLDLVDVGAPSTVFETLQAFDLSLDPRLLAQGIHSDPSLKTQQP